MDSLSSDHRVLPLLLFQSVVRSVGGNLMSMGIESGQDRRWKNVSQERPHPEGSSFNGEREQGSLPVVDLGAPPSAVGWSEAPNNNGNCVTPLILLRRSILICTFNFPVLLFYVFWATGDPSLLRN